MDDPKTIVGFKIKGSRKVRDLIWGAVLIIALFSFLGLFALAQVKMCQDKYPGKPWDQCLKRR